MEFQTGLQTNTCNQRALFDLSAILFRIIELHKSLRNDVKPRSHTPRREPCCYASWIYDSMYLSFVFK